MRFFRVPGALILAPMNFPDFAFDRGKEDKCDIYTELRVFLEREDISDSEGHSAEYMVRKQELIELVREMLWCCRK